MMRASPVDAAFSLVPVCPSLVWRGGLPRGSGLLLRARSSDSSVSGAPTGACLSISAGRSALETIFERVAGLDVHKAQVTACVRVPAAGSGRRADLAEFATTVRGLVALRDWLEAHCVTHVAMEATGVYWQPVWHVLEDAFELTLCNARHVKQVPGRKTDVSDAAWLCQLMEAGLLRGSFVPPKPQRALRTLTRYRKTQIAERQREANRLHKALEDTGTRDRRDPRPPGLPRRAHRSLSDAIEEQLGPFATGVPLAATITGVAERTAQVMIAEIGIDMSCFPSARHLASWAGRCPGNDQSAGKRRSGRRRKGSKWLAMALEEAALAATRTHGSYLQAQYRRLKPRIGHGRAIGAVQHSILVAYWHMFTTGETYRDLGGDYYQRRDPERQTRRLIHQLERLGHRVTLEPAPA